MALFESYERRIDKINSVLNSYGIALSKKQRKSLKMQALTYTIRSKAFSRSASRTLAGHTSQVQLSQSKKTAEEQLTQQQLSVKDFRLSVFLAPLLIHVKQVLDMVTLVKCFWKKKQTASASWLDMSPSQQLKVLSVSLKKQTSS